MCLNLFPELLPERYIIPEIKSGQELKVIAYDFFICTHIIGNESNLTEKAKFKGNKRILILTFTAF